jgi:hypothetical protein
MRHSYHIYFFHAHSPEGHKEPEGNDGPNLYAYVHNNPINYTDSFGLETEQFEEYYYGDVEKHCYCETHRTCKRGGDLDKTLTSKLPKVRHSYTFEEMFAVPLGIDPWKQHLLYEPSLICVPPVGVRDFINKEV